jgi:poly-D-alanine transfer protein DltD
MAHWEFLNEKLGTDIVKYIIQPMLMPSKEEVMKAREKLIAVLSLKWFSYNGVRVQIRWNPSWLVIYKTAVRELQEEAQEEERRLREWKPTKMKEREARKLRRTKGNPDKRSKQI